MKVYKYFNEGKYGTFEEGILFVSGAVRYKLTETGLKRAVYSEKFQNVKELTGNFNKEILKLLCNFIAGDKSVQEDILFMVNPDVIVNFVADNIDGNYHSNEVTRVPINTEEK